MSWAKYKFPNPQTNNPLKTAKGLIAALNSRINTWNNTGYIKYTYSTRGTLSTIAPLTQLKYYSGQDFSSVFEQSLNDFITDTLWANHTYNSGDFSGVAYDTGSLYGSIPIWTVDDIYTYLGETRIDPVSEKLTPAFFAKWAQQKYRVINLLRWMIGAYYDVAVQQRKYGYSKDSWQDTISAHESYAWSTSASYPRLYGTGSYSGSSYEIMTNRVKYYQKNSSDYACNADLYIAGNKGSSNVTYYQILDGLEEDKLLRIENDVNILPGNEYTTDYYTPNISSEPTSSVNFYSANAPEISVHWILKFDVDDGFDFID